jgi:site-specific DNA recombinase
VSSRLPILYALRLSRGLTRQTAAKSRARLLQEPSLPLNEIAAEEGIGSSYVTRLLRLAFLAPDIVTAILNGRQPPHLTANRLMDDTRLPLDWPAQRKLLWS